MHGCLCDMLAPKMFDSKEFQAKCIMTMLMVSHPPVPRAMHRETGNLHSKYVACPSMGQPDMTPARSLARRSDRVRDAARRHDLLGYTASHPCSQSWCAPTPKCRSCTSHNVLLSQRQDGPNNRLRSAQKCAPRSASPHNETVSGLIGTLILFDLHRALLAIFLTSSSRGPLSETAQRS